MASVEVAIMPVVLLLYFGRFECQRQDEEEEKEQEEEKK